MNNDITKATQFTKGLLFGEYNNGNISTSDLACLLQQVNGLKTER